MYINILKQSPPLYRLTLLIADVVYLPLVMMKHNQFVLFLFWLIAFGAITACTSDQNVGVIRQAVKIEVETNHQNEELANLPDPEKSILPESFVTKSYYDAEHLLLKEEKWSADGKLEWKKELVYDEAGNNLERWTFHRDSVVERIVQKFNAANRLIRAEEYGSNEKLLRKSSAAYDRNGKGVVTTFTNIQDEFVKSMESVYDSSGRLIENRYFIQLSGEQLDRISMPGINSWLQKNTYLYDAKNNLIQTMEVDSNLVMSLNTSLAYDSLNNLTTRIIQSTDRSRAQHYRYEYQYNHAGEWTKKRTFLNNHLIVITIRRILTPATEIKK
jgi:hypothetical protein